jgi:hypothetical protein
MRCRARPGHRRGEPCGLPSHAAGPGGEGSRLGCAPLTRRAGQDRAGMRRRYLGAGPGGADGRLPRPVLHRGSSRARHQEDGVVKVTPEQPALSVTLISGATIEAAQERHLDIAVRGCAASGHTAVCQRATVPFQQRVRAMRRLGVHRALPSRRRWGRRRGWSCPGWWLFHLCGDRCCRSGLCTYVSASGVGLRRPRAPGAATCFACCLWCSARPPLGPGPGSGHCRARRSANAGAGIGVGQRAV